MCRHCRGAIFEWWFRIGKKYRFVIRNLYCYFHCRHFACAEEKERSIYTVYFVYSAFFWCLVCRFAHVGYRTSDQTVYGKMWSGCDFRTSKMRMLARPGNVKNWQKFLIGPAVFTGLQMHLKQLQWNYNIIIYHYKSVTVVLMYSAYSIMIYYSNLFGIS